MSNRGFLQKPINIYQVEEEVQQPIIEEQKIEPQQEDWEKNFNSLFNVEPDEPTKEIPPEIVIETPVPVVETVEPIVVTPTPVPIIETIVITPTPIVETKPLVEPIEPIKPSEPVFKNWGKPEGWNKSNKKLPFQKSDDWSTKPPTKTKSSKTSIFKVLYWGIRDQPMIKVSDQHRYDDFMMNFKIGLMVGLTAFLLLLVVFKFSPGTTSTTEYQNNDWFNNIVNWFVDKYFKK